MRGVWLAAIAACGLLAAGQASAEVVTLTYGGSVKSGIDTGGVFAPAGTSLAGDSFSATLVFNGQESANGDIGARGGTLTGTANPVTSATVTINGVELNVPTLGLIENLAVAQLHLTGDVFEGAIDAFEESSGSPGSGLELQFSRVFTGAITTAPFAFSSGAGVDGMLFGPVFGGSYGLTITNASSDQLPGIDPLPEPSTWALLIAGFGAIGAALRRRRSSPLRAAT